MLQSGMKICTRCTQPKPEAEFRKSTRGPLSSWCRECERDYQRNLYAKNPQRIRQRAKTWRAKYGAKYSAIRKAQREKYYAAEIARKYKFPKEEALRLLKTEGSHCKACRTPFDLTKPLLRRSLDHCHKTGKIRGFLCSRCNTVAGMVNDDIELLSKIADYLKRCTTS